MKLIKPSYEIWEQEPGIQGIYKAIEKAGRICYLSGDKITEDSAKPFVDRMINSGHLSVLEHGTVYLKAPVSITGGMGSEEESCPLDKYRNNKYSAVHKDKNIYPDWLYATTNYRVLIEQGWLNDLKYLCEPTEHHERRVAVHFVLPIGISREFCRHRVMSFAEQSTRYCNFSSDKFNNELTFIEDNWCNEELLRQIEYWYINSHLKPQEKRNMLPLCTKTELVMTGFVSDWESFFKLRTPANAHPQARELAIPLREEFVKRELIK